MDDDRITHSRDVAFGEPNQFDDVFAVFGLLLGHLRPGPDAEQWRPLSPIETDRLRIALRVIADAIDVARARKPAHVYVVQKGGR